MTRIPGIGTVVSLLALTIGVTSWLAAAATPSMALQADDPLPVEVGAGPVRERSLGLTGRNLYGPDTVELFGYVTSVIGIDPSLLFTDEAVSEQTARFTYAGNVANATRTNRGDVSVFAGEGVVRIYRDDAGASWADPASFADGEPVAEWSFQLLDTLHRQAPGVGVLVGDGQLVQMTAEEFSLDGEIYRFGSEGIEQRFHYLGAVMGAAVEPGALAVSLTGSASVVAREVIPVNVGGPVVTVAAATPAAAICPELEPWLSQSLDSLTQAQAFDALARANGDLPSVDAATTRQAAADVALLAENQRGLDAPGTASEASRLAITALSTFARGLDVMASAAENQDPDLLSQGRTIVADGRLLLERAEVDIERLGDACVEPS